MMFTAQDNLLQGFGKTTFAGLTESVVQVDTGFIHSSEDHVIADVTRAGEEEAEVAGIHCSHCSHVISFDAGDLHQAADGVAGKS